MPRLELYYMGRLPTSLLIIVLHFFAISCLGADEQVRQIQEELRKRHLFYGNIDGELSPALNAAISHYQKKKGFAVTGTLDPETRASLGLEEMVPQVAPTPFVVVKRDDVRGGNGELLPCSTALLTAQPNQEAWPKAEQAVSPSPAASHEDDVQAPAEGRTKHLRRKTAPPQPAKTSNPFLMAYQRVDHALNLILHDTQPRKKRASKKHG
jgi:peptidoglycan hydrolase-like protein with peptidoglycan-binding domain